MKAQVLVDMDGVLADVYRQFIRMEKQESGIGLQVQDLYGKPESQAFPSYEKHVRSRGFFSTAPLMADSVEGLRYLNDAYKVLIVSSATEFPDSLSEKQKWLQMYYPFITWQQMIFCGCKDSIRGDIMIDDHPRNLHTFEGKKVLFTQPHNIYIEDDRFQRVTNWREIMDLL